MLMALAIIVTYAMFYVSLGIVYGMQYIVS